MQFQELHSGVFNNALTAKMYILLSSRRFELIWGVHLLDQCLAKSLQPFNRELALDMKQCDKQLEALIDKLYQFDRESTNKAVFFIGRMDYITLTQNEPVQVIGEHAPIVAQVENNVLVLDLS